MPAATPSRWLVTGARGFLGANLGCFLGDRAIRISAVRGGRMTAHFDESIELDLTTLGSIASTVEAARPAVVVHAAALASHEECERDPDRAYAINAQAAGELAKVSRRIGARFILISTDAVFSGERGAYREDDDPAPTSVYGRTKLEGEHLVMAEYPSALIVRTNFFGWSPSGKRSILEFFVGSLGEGRPVRGFTDFSVSSIYVQHLVEAIWELAPSEATGAVHVASADSMSKFDFGVAVAQQFGLDAGLIAATLADMDPPRGRDQSLDVTRAQSLLGRPLPTTREGIAAAQADAELRAQLLHGLRP